MATASGIEKKLILAPQAAQGTIATAALATAQYLRRVTSTLNLTKETYSSNEMNANRQVADFRHGVRSVDGSISGELSPGTYSLLQAAILRKDFIQGVLSSGDADITSAVTAGAAGTFTSAATATWLTDGFKIGDVVRFTGFVQAGTDARANNAHNFLLTAVTETVLTGIMLDGVAVVAKAETESVTATVVGHKTWVPETAHTENWFSIEHAYTDVDLSEVFWDVKVNTMAFKLPASGMATTDIGIMGLNKTNFAAGAAPYFSAVLAADTHGVLASVNGVLCVSGVQVALLTGLDFDIAAGLTSEGVVGSNVKPDIFDGKVQVKGNMTVFFTDATFRDYFENETEVSINCAFTTSNSPTADFLAFSFPRVKVGGASKDDGEKGIIQTMPFVALFNTTGGAATGATATANLATTMSIQDSTL
jgi:hypothetical protein